VRTVSYSWTVTAGILLTLLVSVILPAGPLLAADSADTLAFIDGFDACQGKNYGAAVEKLSRFLHEYPASPLRDMTLYWLARAQYGSGDRHEAAHTMARFLREYPSHPLAGSGEADLLTLAAEYGKIEGAGTVPPPSPQKTAR
jgi:TolA-binding protein